MCGQAKETLHVGWNMRLGGEGEREREREGEERGMEGEAHPVQA